MGMFEDLNYIKLLLSHESDNIDKNARKRRVVGITEVATETDIYISELWTNFRTLFPGNDIAELISMFSIIQSPSGLL